MSALSEQQIEAMRSSLEGLAVGDAFGDRVFFEFHSVNVLELPLEKRPLPIGFWTYTDDTQMALSIVEVLCKQGQIDQAALAASFGEHFDPTRGYGPAMYTLLPQLRTGADWRSAASALFAGSGSFGNGAAMRVAPLGACFAHDLPLLIEQAALSAQITHAHPEAIAGAIAVALAAAHAYRSREANQPPQAGEFLDLIASAVPHSDVQKGILRARDLPESGSIWEIVRHLGNGSEITAQDTVPYALWCAAHRLRSYPEALWLTASGSGDIDTNCAIVGGIVACATGSEAIPAKWRERAEALPSWPFAP
jgi:ADP-ribosylglycohydrolase